MKTNDEKQDNWANRSAGMRCVSCMWFTPKGDKGLGRCRRHAPTLSGWPAVFERPFRHVSWVENIGNTEPKP